jgi:hypothetical protein
MSNLHQQLAMLQAKRKEIEAQEKQVRLLIIDEMQESGEIQVVSEYGKATITPHTSYTYSEKITALAEKLDLAKVKERQSGKAKSTVTIGLTFTPKK